MNKFRSCFQIIFVLFIVYFMVRIINKLRKEKRKYFTDFWNMLEFATIIMSIVAVGMFALKIIFGNTAMDVLHQAGTGDYLLRSCIHGDSPS